MKKITMKFLLFFNTVLFITAIFEIVFYYKFPFILNSYRFCLSLLLSFLPFFIIWLCFRKRSVLINRYITFIIVVMTCIILLFYNRVISLIICDSLGSKTSDISNYSNFDILFDTDFLEVFPKKLPSNSLNEVYNYNYKAYKGDKSVDDNMWYMSFDIYLEISLPLESYNTEKNRILDIIKNQKNENSLYIVKNIYELFKKYMEKNDLCVNKMYRDSTINFVAFLEDSNTIIYNMTHRYLDQPFFLRHHNDLIICD